MQSTIETTALPDDVCSEVLLRLAPADCAAWASASRAHRDLTFAQAPHLPPVCVDREVATRPAEKVLPWLRAKIAAGRNLRVTWRAMDSAAKRGLLPVVRLLSKELKQRCSGEALKGAVRAGSVGVVRFLLQNHPECHDACWHVTWDAAVRGDDRVLNLLIGQMKKSGSCTLTVGHSMQAAVMSGHTRSAMVLFNNRRCECGCGCTASVQGCLMLAAKKGSLHLVRLLFENCPECHEDVAVAEAARSGHAHVVSYLLGAGMAAPNAMDDVAGSGRLDSMRLLHTSGVGCTALAATFAAYGGHLDVLRFLLLEASKECTEDAADAAAANGHLDVLRFLLLEAGKGCTEAAVDGAAANGHLDVVRFLVKEAGAGCTKAAMDCAAAGGHLHVLKWLYANHNVGCTRAAMEQAAAIGRVDVLQWLRKKCRARCSQKAALNAAEHGHADVLMWLHKNTQACSRLSEAAMLTAAKNGHAEVVRLLREHGLCAVHPRAVLAAASNGHLRVVQTLLERRPQLEGLSPAFVAAVTAGHMDVARLLLQHGPVGEDEPVDDLMDELEARGHEDMARALYDARIL